MVDLDIALWVDPLEFVPYAVGEILGIGDQGKTFAVPNSLIEFGGSRGPERKDKAIENDLPFPGGNVDHPWVTEEIAQILAQGAGSRSFRGTELHEDHLGFALRRDVF